MKKQDKDTKAKIREFAGENKLYKAVVRDILEDAKNYSGDTLKDRVLARLEDVLHGCSTGVVTSLIYYSDTVKFYKRHRADIIALVRDTADSCGESVGAFLDSLTGWDKNDPFVDEQFNQNFLAWFAYEETAYRLQSILDA